MSTSAESSSQGARNANATQNPSLSAWGTDRLSLCTLPRVLWEKLETSSQRFNSLKCEYQGYEEVAVFQEEREVDLDEIKKLPDWDLSCITTGELGLHLLSVLTGLYLYDGLRKICPIFFQISDFTKPHSTNYDCSVILEKRFGPMGSPIKPSQFTPAGSTSDPRKVRELIRQVEESLIGDYHINYEPIASATPVAPHLSCPLYDIIHVRIHRTGAPAVVVKEFPDKRSSWWKDSPRSSWFFNTAYTTFLVTKSPSAGPESEANDDSPLPLPTLGSNILYINGKSRNPMPDRPHPSDDESDILLKPKHDGAFRREIKTYPIVPDPANPAPTTTRKRVKDDIFDFFPVQLKVLGAPLMRNLVESGIAIMNTRTSDFLKGLQSQVNIIEILLSAPRQSHILRNRLNLDQSTSLERGVKSFLGAFDCEQKLQDLPSIFRSQNIRLLPFGNTIYTHLRATLPQDHPLMEELSPPTALVRSVTLEDLAPIFSERGRDGTWSHYRDIILKDIEQQLDLAMRQIAESVQNKFETDLVNVFGASITTIVRRYVLDAEIERHMSNVKRLVHDEFARARQQWDRPAVETTAVQDWYTSHRNEIGTAIYHQAEQDSNQRTQSPSIELWMDVSSRDYTQEFQFCMGFAARAASMIEPLATNAVQGVLRLFVNPLKDVVTRKLNQDLRQWLSNVDLSTEELRVASQEQSKLLALIRKHTPSP